MKQSRTRPAIAACMVMSALICTSTSLSFFVSPVTSELGFDRGVFMLYFSLITIVGTFTLPVYGRLIEKIGTRKVIIAGGVWTGTMLACFSLCKTLPMFYLFGCLAGLGFFGCTYASAPVIVSTWFHEKQNTIMGIASACGGATFIVMSLIYPVVIDSLGWNTGYLLVGFLFFALTTPAGLFLLRPQRNKTELEPSGRKEDAALDNNDLQGTTYKDALKSGRLWLMTVAFIVLAGTNMIAQHLPSYFIELGYSTIMAGIFMSISSVGVMATSVLSGWVSDKVGLFKAFAIASLLYMLAFIVLAISSEMMIISCALLLLSIGNSIISVFAPASTSVVFGKKDYASIWGIISMGNVLGQAIGAPLWGFAYDLTGGYQAGMYATAVIVFIVAAILLTIIKPPKKNRI